MSASLFGTGGVVNVSVNGSLIPQSFVGTSGQTLFTLTAFTYTLNTSSLLVFINGQKQVVGRDFVETSTSSFTLIEGVVAGDYVDVLGFPEVIDSSSNSTLRADLIDTTLAAKNAGLSGYNPALSYALKTVGSALQRQGISLSQINGADPTGVADSTAAINIALSIAATLGATVICDGLFRFTSTLTFPRAVVMEGGGYTADTGSTLRAVSCLLKDFNGVGVYLIGDYCGMGNLQVDCTAGKTGDNIQLGGTRSFCRYVSSTNAGACGFKVGLGIAGNTNVWHLDNCVAAGNASHGLHVTDPSGSTDANAGVCVNFDARANGGDGIREDSAAWNTYIAPCLQANTGYGFRITALSRSCAVLGGDIEGNTAGQGVLETGTVSHTIMGGFFGGPTWVDNSANPGANVLIQNNSSISKVAHGQEVNITSPQPGALATINGWVETALSNVGRIAMYLSGAAGGTLKFYTKIDGGALAPALVLDEKQRTYFRAGRIDTLTLVTYSASMTLDSALGVIFQITATNNTAFTINAPTNPFTGSIIDVTIRNSAGSALGAVTWNAVFKLAAWTSPANGFSRSIRFHYDGANWIENNRTAADIPN